MSFPVPHAYKTSDTIIVVDILNSMFSGVAWVQSRILKICYIMIVTTKSPSFRKTAFSASLTNPTVRLPQSRDPSYYVSRIILAPPTLRLQKNTDPRAYEFAQTLDL